jgi:hypothetical protein
MLNWRVKLAGAGPLIVLLVAGCGSVTNLFNEEFLAAFGRRVEVANLPGDAPGLLVSVGNLTNRWITTVISYRDGDDAVQSYTTTVGPGEKTGQMLVCPVQEITLGDVGGLQTSGARVYLVDSAGTAADLATAPYIDVEPFGTLLKEVVNYDCGDEVVFSVENSGLTSSGYQTYAYIRRAGS